MLQRVALLFLVIGMLNGYASAESARVDGVQDNTVSSSFVEGTHYKLLSKPITGPVAPVMEFFYFGCRTCYQLVPVIANWSHQTGHGVSLVPAHSESSLVQAARLHHTFAEMGVLGKMYELGYVIFQTEQSNLQGEDRINDFLKRHGVDQDKFWTLWSSEAVEKRLMGSLALTKQAQIAKTPAFIVKGKYVVDIDSITSVEQLLELISFLIEEKAVGSSAS